MERDILHYAIPDFPVALARLEDPALRGRPVAVVPGHSDRAILQAVSAEARAEGLYAGMTAFRARRLCPALLTIPPNPPGAVRACRELLKHSGSYSPLAEPTTPGGLFLDLTGCRRLLGPARDLAARFERDIADRLGLQGTIGVAGNKLVSRIAAGCLAKPGLCEVLRGAEPSFIGPLPVSVLPGIGRSREAVLLQDLNLQRVEDVASLPVRQLRLAFGPFAPLLRQRAQGCDPSPVRPPTRSPRVTEEAFLGRDEQDDLLILAELCRLVESCGLRLRQAGRKTGHVSLMVHFADGVAEQSGLRLAEPVNHDLLLFAAADDLFRRTCRRRVRVKGLKLTCAGLDVGRRQMPLFPERDRLSTRQVRLQEALDRVRRKYGMTVVQRGRSFAS